MAGAGAHVSHHVLRHALAILRAWAETRIGAVARVLFRLVSGDSVQLFGAHAGCERLVHQTIRDMALVYQSTIDG